MTWHRIGFCQIITILVSNDAAIYLKKSLLHYFPDISLSQEDAKAVDCHHHLRNVWFNGLSKKLATYMKIQLQSDLSQIDGVLRISTNIEAVIRAIDKEFSLCANYPKGKGDQFKFWICQNHPGALLLHLQHANGSRQDICVEAAGSIY